MLKNLDRYATKRYESNILCFDMRSFYLAGRPGSNSDASLVIGIERNPDMITDDNHPDFNQELNE